MKHLLCYGDSNTWGAIPANQGRFDEEHRWTALMARELGDGYRVYEEGLCGRTSVFDDPGTPYRNGKDLIVPLLRTHKPLDLVILMLGTNDLKPGLAKSAADVASGIETLIGIILDPASLEGDVTPAILVVSPMVVGENIEKSFFNEIFGGRKAISLSRGLSPLLEAVARKHGCLFLDAARVTPSSVEDSIHLSAEGHTKLAHALADQVRGHF